MNMKNLSRKIQIQILRWSIIIHGGSLESATFSDVHDLDLGSGHTANHHASLINLYLLTKFS